MLTRLLRRARRATPWLGVAAFAATLAAAPSNAPTRLLRTPTVSATHIAFAYAQNIWVVERGGGQARRLTSFQGQASNPRFSPDGSMIAFSAEYAGNTDVYVVPALGGEPRRLTWHPGADTVQGWTPDGTVGAVRVGPCHVGAERVRLASGRCRPTGASRSRCRCRARIRASSPPTARASRTA